MQRLPSLAITLANPQGFLKEHPSASEIIDNLPDISQSIKVVSFQGRYYFLDPDTSKPYHPDYFISKDTLNRHFTQVSA